MPMKRASSSNKPAVSNKKKSAPALDSRQSSLSTFFFSGKASTKGFANAGNTCYMAAALSALFSLHSVARMLQRGGSQGRATSRLAELLEQFLQRCAGASGAMQVEALKEAVAARDRTFAEEGVQQDVHEFLCGLLNCCDVEAREEASGAGAASASVARSICSIFEGSNRLTLCCRGCGHAWSRVEKFLHLSLELPPGGSAQLSEMLSAALTTATDVEYPARIFSRHLGACRRRPPRARADQKVPKDASHRDLSDATLRFDLAPRRSLSARAER